MNAGGATVLIAEDEALVREVIECEFEDEGYTVLGAASGEEALALLQQGRAIDVLVTDIRMPGRIDGWALASKARMLKPDIGVIYVSGYTGDQLQPVDGALFFKKPFRASALVEAAMDLMRAGRGSG